MPLLVESVPNVSEGRRLDVVERLASAVASVPGVHFLDRTSDASHNRSVLTLAGEVPAVAAGLERLVAACRRERRLALELEHRYRAQLNARAEAAARMADD